MLFFVREKEREVARVGKCPSKPTTCDNNIIISQVKKAKKGKVQMKVQVQDQQQINVTTKHRPNGNKEEIIEKTAVNIF